MTSLTNLLQAIEDAKAIDDKFVFDRIPESSFNVKINQNNDIAIHIGPYVTILNDKREKQLIDWLINAAIKTKVLK